MADLGTFFWILMLIWLLFGSWTVYRDTSAPGTASAVRVSGFGGHILMWLIVFCFGCKVFGFPLH